MPDEQTLDKKIKLNENQGKYSDPSQKFDKIMEWENETCITRIKRTALKRLRKPGKPGKNWNRPDGSAFKIG